MRGNIFLYCVNSSIAVSWVLIVIFIIRFILKRFPKRFHCFLWYLAGVRFIIPTCFVSKFSLLPSSATFDVYGIYKYTFKINSGIDYLDKYVNNYIGDHYYEGITIEPGTSLLWVRICTLIWILGMVLMFVYLLISSIKLKIRIKTAVRIDDNVWSSDMITGSFVYGLWNPRIFVPNKQEETRLPYILAHEKAHIKRKDNLFKVIAYILLALNWYNPFFWIAYVLYVKDMELACDEQTIKAFDENERRKYADTVFNCSLVKNEFTHNVALFGGISIKERVERVIGYKKTNKIIIFISIMVVLFIVVRFLTNPIIDDLFFST